MNDDKIISDKKENIQKEGERTVKKEILTSNSKKIINDSDDNIENTKITILEYCDLYNLRSLIKEQCSKMFSTTESKLPEEWRSLLKEKQIVDFNNKRYFN